MHFFQFFGAAFGSAVVIGAASLLWPLVTASTMPPALENVRDFVMKTSVGQEASKVLGVSDPLAITPINIPDIISKKASETISNSTNTVNEIVSTTVITQMVTRFKELPEDQKQIVRTSICTIPEVEKEPSENNP